MLFFLSLFPILDKKKICESFVSKCVEVVGNIDHHFVDDVITLFLGEEEEEES